MAWLGGKVNQEIVYSISKSSGIWGGQAKKKKGRKTLFNRLSKSIVIHPRSVSLRLPSAFLPRLARSPSPLERACAPPSCALALVPAPIFLAPAPPSPISPPRLLFPHKISAKNSSAEAPNRRSSLRTDTAVAMSWPPRPRAAVTGEAAAWSSPLRQVPQGFEDPQASCGDSMEFTDVSFLPGQLQQVPHGTIR